MGGGGASHPAGSLLPHPRRGWFADLPEVERFISGDSVQVLENRFNLRALQALLMTLAVG